MKGKIILITGGTSGIGAETARSLFIKGATLLLISRDKEKAKQLFSNWANQVHIYECDLSSQAAISLMSESIARDFDRIDVLINNAGWWPTERKLSSEGVEETFAINAVAPFSIIIRLLPLLRKSDDARIINLASGLHQGTLQFDDLEFEKNFNGYQAYRQSKLAVILMTRLLANKLKGSTISAYSVHPGVVRTNLGRNYGFIARFIFHLMGTSVKKGAMTSLYLATAVPADEHSGEYFQKSKVARASSESHDLQAAEKLWDILEGYTGLFFDFKSPKA